MTTELVRRDQDAFELGKVFKASGMFKDMRNEAEAVVKILAGREFGLGPMASLNGIHMVDGKPTLAANLIAGQIKRHPTYDYKIIRREHEGCELEFFEDGKSVGLITFEKKDAAAAGLLGKGNWKKYPRDMYFARCLTSGARTYCPDVLGGSPVYTAEELGAEDAPVIIPDPVVAQARRTPTLQVADIDDGTINHAASAEHNAGASEDVLDAKVVAPEPDSMTPADEKVGTSLLDYLRDTFLASGKTQDDLAWMLLSVGVESLPESPSKEDIGTAMRGLTVDQAKRLDGLFQDDAVPGSGETT